MVMQGVLQKWTNYVHGWQPRWWVQTVSKCGIRLVFCKFLGLALRFVLVDSVMSYYPSHDHITMGSKGSFNVCAAEIVGMF